MLRAEDSLPVPDAGVELEVAGGPSLSAVTDLSGEARFEVPASGGARVRVAATMRSFGTEQDLDLDEASTRLRERDSLEILVPGASVARGYVTGPDRLPVAGA